MTETGRKFKELAQKDRELTESERHNRAQEKVGKWQAQAAGLRGAGSIAKALINDPSWYNKYPDLASYASRGLSLNPLGDDLLNQADTESIPYGLVYYYVDSVGPQPGTNPARFPINKELVALHQSIMSTNSRVTTIWDAGDLGQVIMVWCSLAGEVIRLQKAVKATLLNEPYGYNQGNAVIRALGFRPMVFRSGVPLVKDAIYRIISKLNQVPIPSNLSFVARKLFINGLLIKDQDLVGAQFYAMVPHGHFYYDETNNQAVRDMSYLACDGIGNTIGNLEGYLTTLENQIDNLMLSNSIKSMFTDIRSAYKEAELVQLTAEDLNVALDIPVSHEICTQLMNIVLPPLDYEDLTQGNATSFKTMVDIVSLNIQANTDGYLVQHKTTYSSGHPTGVALESNVQGVASDFRLPLVNFYQDNVSDDDVMVATRLTTEWKIPSGHDSAYAETCGTEVVLTATFIVPGTILTGGVALTGHALGGRYDTGYTNFNSDKLIYILSLLSHFNYTPQIVTCVSSDGEFAPTFQYGNVFSVASSASLLNMHRAAIQSMLKFIPVDYSGFANIRSKSKGFSGSHRRK